MIARLVGAIMLVLLNVNPAAAKSDKVVFPARAASAADALVAPVPPCEIGTSPVDPAFAST